jgi:lipopolysaccharide export system permease protein
MEGHYRLAQPPMAFAIALIGLAFLLAGDFNRRGQLRRVMAAVVVVLAMEITLLGIKNLGEQTQWLTPLIYLTTIVPAILAALMISPWRRPTRRRALPDMPVGGT